MPCRVLTMPPAFSLSLPDLIGAAPLLEVISFAPIYLSTIFTSFFGTTTVFTISLPAIKTEMRGSFSA